MWRSRRSFSTTLLILYVWSEHRWLSQYWHWFNSLSDNSLSVHYQSVLFYSCHSAVPSPTPAADVQTQKKHKTTFSFLSFFFLAMQLLADLWHFCCKTASMWLFREWEGDEVRGPGLVTSYCCLFTVLRQRMKKGWRQQKTKHVPPFRSEEDAF